MKKVITITIEIPSLKTAIVTNLIEEIKQDAIEKEFHITNNANITKKHNKVLKELQSFLQKNLTEFPIEKNDVYFSDFHKSMVAGFVGLTSKNIPYNYPSSAARLGFELMSNSEFIHKHKIAVLNGEFTLRLITKNVNEIISINDIGQIFEKGKSTLKEMMLKDFSYA